MRTNKKQKRRIEQLEHKWTDGLGNLHTEYFNVRNINVNKLLEDFVTDRFLINENGEVETIINTPESYFDMLIDFLDFINTYNITYEK